MQTYTVILEHDSDDKGERRVNVTAANQYDAYAIAQMKLNGTAFPLSGWQPVGLA